MQIRQQDIRQFIVSAIEAGDYATGSRLPTERALCETLAVSRNAVRGALAVLEGEGWVRRVAGSGTYVAERGGAAGQDIALLSSPSHIMEARLVIEPHLAGLVCANGTALDFAEMDRCVEAGAAAQRLEIFEKWDTALHEAIAGATKNPVIIAACRMISRARDGSEWGELKRRSLTPERRAVYQAQHEEIVSALRRRDAGAAEAAMRAHLLRIRENLLAL
jgi:DNA-binding FadR family transcriptional regulator